MQDGRGTSERTGGRGRDGGTEEEGRGGEEWEITGKDERKKKTTGMRRLHLLVALVSLRSAQHWHIESIPQMVKRKETNLAFRTYCSFP